MEDIIPTLNPCPKCGAPAEIHVEIDNKTKMPICYYVECTRCKTYTYAAETQDNILNVVDEWNEGRIQSDTECEMCKSPEEMVARFTDSCRTRKTKPTLMDFARWLWQPLRKSPPSYSLPPDFDPLA